MTVYTTLPADDLNLAVTVVDDPNLVKINITPASINLTGAVNSVNGLTGVVVLTTTQIPEGTNLYYTDARTQTLINTNAAGFITADSTSTLTNKSGNISQWTNDSGYSTTVGTVTPSSTDTFTNKSGNISQWTNDSGYITSETDSQTLSFSVPNLSISSGNSVDLTPLTLGYITADSTNTLTNKSGNVSMFTNDAGYSTTTGTVTPTSTDTFTNKSGNISMWTNDSAYLVASALSPYYTSTQVNALPVSTFTNDAGYTTATGTVTPTSTDTFTNKSGNISMWTNDSGYTTNTGTVTATSTDTFTNKSGNISQWTNDSGYLTAETDSQTLSFTSPNLTISNGNTVDIGSLEVATIDGGTY